MINLIHSDFISRIRVFNLRRLSSVAVVLFVLLATSSGALGLPPQQRGKLRKIARQSTSENRLSKLREEFVEATRSYKASLEKLIVAYEKNVAKAEAQAVQSRALYEQGLISRKQLDENELAITLARDKVNQVRHQMVSAETQIANTLVEAEADERLAKARLKKGSLVRTTSYIRYHGSGQWDLSNAWKVQRFFLDNFKRPLPIAVFGQGPIHDRWRLDHRGSIDVSLNPDSAEGQTLLSFLRTNGIPFLAFRGAIPGTSTGPHIHIGRPSHRY